MKYVVKIGEQEVTFDYDESSGKLTNQNKREVPYDWVEVAKGCFSLLLNGKSYLLYLEPSNGSYRLFTEGRMISASVQDEQNVLISKLVKAHKGEPKEQIIKASIPGLVTKVFVKVGDSLKKDDSILTLEAMKMENLIKAPCGCVVEKILVEPGQTVQQNQELVLLKKVE
ncbi:acetyl-CoA carboxylase biotin carboxyl carrier protein subunit [Caldithrix abyssi]